MKAVDFVKEFGWDEAIGFCNWASENKSDFAPYDFELVISGGDSVSYFELKRLVESWELVERLGGLEMAKGVAAIDDNESYLGERFGNCDELKQAIADVESCQ